MAKFVLATTSQGQIRGVESKNAEGNPYYSFWGIPYAKPLIGERKFKAPVPAEPWKDTLDATQSGAACWSTSWEGSKFIGTENCLIVNVFTPYLPNNGKNKLLPVMVWIHGGGFVDGFSTERAGPDFLLTQNIVLVSINYRVGIWGFLHLEDSSLGVPGNAGLKDMILALKWVQKEISNFNGNPNNVTIFGISAGGCAVHYLVLSPLAKGLFHKAIAQSGSALNPWAIAKDGAKRIVEVLDRTDLVNEKDILEFLQEVPPEKLVQAQNKISNDLIASRMRPFGPVIESATDGAFLTENPLDLILSGKFNKVPFIAGFTTAEGIIIHFYYENVFSNDTVLNLESYVPHFLGYPPGSKDSKTIAKKIQDFYFGGKQPNRENAKNLYALATDVLFLYGIYVMVKNHAKKSSSPVYFYQMSVESNLNFSKSFVDIDNTFEGVAHGEDTHYIFKTDETPKIEPGSLEDISVKRFIKMWTNFARFGNPTPDDSLDVKWKNVTDSNEIHFLDIGEKLTLQTNPEIQRMNFWKEIFQNSPNGYQMV